MGGCVRACVAQTPQNGSYEKRQLVADPKTRCEWSPGERGQNMDAQSGGGVGLRLHRLSHGLRHKIWRRRGDPVDCSGSLGCGDRCIRACPAQRPAPASNDGRVLDGGHPRERVRELLSARRCTRSGSKSARPWPLPASPRLMPCRGDPFARHHKPCLTTGCYQQGRLRNAMQVVERRVSRGKMCTPCIAPREPKKGPHAFGPQESPSRCAMQVEARKRGG